MGIASIKKKKELRPGTQERRNVSEDFHGSFSSLSTSLTSKSFLLFLSVLFRGHQMDQCLLPSDFLRCGIYVLWPISPRDSPFLLGRRGCYIRDLLGDREWWAWRNGAWEVRRVKLWRHWTVMVSRVLTSLIFLSFASCDLTYSWFFQVTASLNFRFSQVVVLNFQSIASCDVTKFFSFISCNFWALVPILRLPLLIVCCEH